MAPIARSAALLRHQPAGAVLVIGLQQPVNLTAAEMKKLRRLDAQPPVADLLDGFKTMQLFFATR
ncbi:hypothetical protein A4R29_30705 (plasmid) [Mesorhizobium ciceri biovar biserrulae]|nr:hypothetical protein A4R28_31085 [Mesorhizobium ciceri]AMY04059.1 hypothetical protein A4R29_30705 [Mesorhizobium ciceri biovar biserrulae]